jgi:1,4-alpha-glucan branching enzyme
MVKKTVKKAKTALKPKRKRIQFSLHAPEAQRVSVAGDFNAWNPDTLVMKKGTEGTWKASVNLEPGRYEYRYLVDGSWMEDPNCPERTANPYGGQNSVISVG